MFMLHSLLLKSHILLGVIALLLFWLPMFSRKGSALHRRSGRYYGLYDESCGVKWSGDDQHGLA